MQPPVGNQKGQAISEFLFALIWIAPLLGGCLWLISRSVRHTQCLQQTAWAASYLKSGRTSSIPAGWIWKHKIRWERGSHQWTLTARCVLQPVTWQIPDIE